MLEARCELSRRSGLAAGLAEAERGFPVCWEISVFNVPFVFVAGGSLLYHLSCCRKDLEMDSPCCDNGLSA